MPADAIILDDWALLARLALGLVLALAAFAKLLDREGFRASLEDFGAPGALAPALVYVVPVVESAVAVLLVPASTALLGAASATLLLLFFTALVAVSLARGRKAACRCFGPLSADSIGPGTLARNLGLTALAAFAWWGGPGPGPVAWWTALPPEGKRLFALAAPLGLLLAGMAVALVRLSRVATDLGVRVERMERMHGPVDGLPLGSPAPAFTLPTLAGGVGGMPALLREDRLLTLVFLTPGCDHCEGLKADLAAWAPRLDLAVVTRTGEKSGTGLDADRVLLQEEWEVGERYRCEGVPSAVVVGPGPWIASLPVSGSSAVRTLLAALSEEGVVPDWARND